MSATAADQTCRSTAYLEAKAEGDKRMPLKRGVHGGAQGLASRDLRHTVKAGLLEPQSPAMQRHILRSQRLLRSRQDTPPVSSPGSTLSLVGGEECPHPRGRQGTYVTLDNVHPQGNTGSPTGREPQGDGAPVVVRGRESRSHGEGEQVSRCPTREVREMRTAETVLGIIRARGRP